MHGRLTRAFAGLSALWSLFVLSAPTVAHRCPVHSLPSAGIAHVADGPEHASVAHDHAHGADHGAPTGKNTCCCPDCGCAHGTFVWSAPTLAAVLVNAPSTEPQLLVPALVAVWSRAPHSLPLANAPPLS